MFLLWQNRELREELARAGYAGVRAECSVEQEARRAVEVFEAVCGMRTL
jgi:hypothetical protein